MKRYQSNFSRNKDILINEGNAVLVDIITHTFPLNYRTLPYNAKRKEIFLLYVFFRVAYYLGRGYILVKDFFSLSYLYS
ncbi:hypothetical protein EDF67_101384 [Sphingobacterium sp. JUb78]|nr:hypothetical protein [Sphingobacterium kitahiroshimense]TCR14280.1 hypothetical protein EDF67_101384 [Sphingobacterium sp. JUb78]